MLVATELKNNVAFVLEGKPYKVVKYEHQKIGRGSASVVVTFRSLETGRIETRTWVSSTKFDEIHTQKRQLQYLYKDPEMAFFMDPVSFDQVEIPLPILGDDVFFLKEGESATILFWNDKALQAEIPPKVVLEVVDTDPGVKGNSVSNIYKPAKLENGMIVKVPLFIKNGEKIRVDTRTSEYIERA